MITASQCKTAKPKPGKKARRYGLGHSLYLQVTEFGGKDDQPKSYARSFIFRYKGSNGRRHDMGLGSVEVITLAAARDLAIDYRRLLAADTDPMAHRAASK